MKETYPKIKHLSEDTINKIAAGEVIERPASVVKELVENAIDAGARDIQIHLEQSGKNLIKIIDNGRGMEKQDLAIAALPHTTSKLDENDLLKINSFGFRGEALPSIAAVAKLSITTRCDQNNTGFRIRINGGVKQGDIEETLCSKGTQVEVRDLFFAVPARLKFLRSDRSELSAIVDVVKKIALSYPKISFILSHESRKLLNLNQQNDELGDQLGTNRIKDLMGEDFSSNSAELKYKSDNISITGHISLPTYTRATSSEQFLFVNNRPIKDKMLMIALKVAYQDYIAPGRYPMAVIFIDIPCHLVDFNVHPAKAEIRFQEPKIIKSILIRAISDALLTQGQKVSSHIVDKFTSKFNVNSTDSYSPDLAPKGNAVSDNNRIFHNIEPSAASRGNGGADNYEGNSIKNWLARGQAAGINSNHSINNENNVNADLSQNSIFTPKPTAQEYQGANQINNEDKKDLEFPLGAARIQIFDCYIISQKPDSIIIIDQHAAHERIGYEKIKNQIAKDGLQKQALLIPEIVKLPDEKRVKALADNISRLSDLALDIKIMGDLQVQVQAVPVIVGDFNIERLVKDLADILYDTSQTINLDQLIEHVTETYACHYSIRSGRKLNYAEINALLREMEQTAFSGQCNHGRPTYIELKKTDIEKLFGRK